MTVLSDQQVAALRRLDATVGADPARMKSGRKFADNLRRALPDTDDVGIALSLMEVAEFVATLIEVANEAPGDSEQGEAALTAVASTLACAAVALTELHWREEPLT